MKKEKAKTFRLTEMNSHGHDLCNRLLVLGDKDFFAVHHFLELSFRRNLF